MIRARTCISYLNYVDMVLRVHLNSVVVGDVKPKGMVDGVQVGCFPQLYQALGSNLPDQIITL